MFKPHLARNIPVQRGFSDFDAFGSGFYFATTWTGCLDAPDYIPQGSVRVHNTIKHCPNLSLGHRDWDTGHQPIGSAHDGPEAPAIREGFCQ